MTSPDVEAMNEAAWAHVEAGRAEEAARLFRDILQQDPANAEAWMMTGMLQAQAGNADQAVASLGRAIQIDPGYADPYLHLARLQLAAGQIEGALANARMATRCDDAFTEAWQILGELGARAGDKATAEQAYRQVVTLDPGRADIRNRLAAVLASLGRNADALRECHAALTVAPDNPEIHANLGNIHYQQGEFAAAAAAFEAALQIAPEFTGARLNLGNALRALHDYRGAGECYRRLVDANPGSVEGHLGLGECCLQAGEYQRALDCYGAALARAPGLTIAQLNKGVTLGMLGRYPEALEAFNNVLAAEPRQLDAWINRGLIEKKLGRFSEALASLRQAEALAPNNPNIQLSLALLELLLGDFDNGWRHYGARKSVRDRGSVAPESLHGDLGGRRILLVKDQGLGDEIFFLRFARRLKERGAWLACQTDPKIASLVSRMDFLDHVVAESVAPPQADLILSVGDLPHLLGCVDPAAQPAPAGLAVLPEARDRVRALLAPAGRRPLIGVTWWAGTRQPGATLGDRLAYREAPLASLADYLGTTGATVIILQRNPDAAEIEAFARALGREVFDMSSLNDDLEAMLALLAELDDYVGVDNTNMHLCASLGKPCRILVPHPPEWRMTAHGETTPWFPGSTLYRQAADGDWQEAFARLARDLQAAHAGAAAPFQTPKVP